MSTRKYTKIALWTHYADVFHVLGNMPKNSSLEDADCAIALSFGRNSILDKDLPHVRYFYDSYGNSEETMDHISHPYFSGFNPGKPNNEIAVAAYTCFMHYQIPMILQWEISMSLYQRNGEAWVKNRFAHQELFALWPPPRPAYRTIEVLEDAYKITQEKGWKRPILLAHDYHMPRVAMLARHFWPEFIIGFRTITRAFDQKSLQSITASQTQWYTYEIKARVRHLLYGWCFGHFRSGRL